MVLQFHNTLTRRKEPFVPRDEGRVGIYLCGPTVYGEPHIGNLRNVVVFDVLRRHLAASGYQVLYIRNYTDVDDKIINAADHDPLQAFVVAEHWSRVYDEITAALGVLPPDIAPRASGHIPEMLALIARLVDAGVAYQAAGDVYFAVAKWPEYGKLSGRDPAELLAGARVEVNPDKRDPLDFALWKAQKEGEDTAWDSPWGRGRPGWHIECSAMAETILGLDFDIHGGGLDLVFPHHENEIAQTEAGRGRPLARSWVHNGMVRFGEEKMAKSVGNIRLLSDALDEFGRDALIMYFLGGHYRQPLAFSAESLEQAQRSVERVANFCRLMRRAPDAVGGQPGETVATPRDSFFDALADDFNTPQALAALFALVAEGNRRLQADETLPGAAAAMAQMLPVIGLERLLEPEEPLAEEAMRLADEREEARRAGEYERADSIRKELADRGYEVRDTSDGPVLVRTRDRSDDGA